MNEQLKEIDKTGSSRSQLFVLVIKEIDTMLEAFAGHRTKTEPRNEEFLKYQMATQLTRRTDLLDNITSKNRHIF